MSDWTIVVKLDTDDPRHARKIILDALRQAGVEARTTNFEANLRPVKPPPLVRLFKPEHERDDDRDPHRRRK
jgi:hypothetical protein